MTQVWHELLFAHWPIASEQLRPLIPPQLEIDAFEREAWVGIVPFRMTDVHPRYLPSVYGLSAFPELNVRTYVISNGIPGVYFFSLDAGNPIVVAIARTVFHLPYFNAVMRSLRLSDYIHYQSRRIHRGAPPAEYVALYRPIAPVEYSRRGTLVYWFTERYALYTVFRNCLYRCDIHHRQWPLQIAELETTRDTMALSHGIHLPDTAPLLHYALKQEVLTWALKRVGE